MHGHNRTCVAQAYFACRIAFRKEFLCILEVTGAIKITMTRRFFGKLQCRVDFKIARTAAYGEDGLRHCRDNAFDKHYCPAQQVTCCHDHEVHGPIIVVCIPCRLQVSIVH